MNGTASHSATSARWRTDLRRSLHGSQRFTKLVGSRWRQFKQIIQQQEFSGRTEGDHNSLKLSYSQTNVVVEWWCEFGRILWPVSGPAKRLRHPMTHVVRDVT